MVVQEVVEVILVQEAVVLHQDLVVVQEDQLDDKLKRG
jgi:hypothetical protein